jgi:16S rRNA (guanine966-N2)-methyltransferase
MRVIAGEFRSRKILSMPGTDIRPTPDRLRETLFNILNPLLEDCVFVDAYAGTGSVGIEALSRGARHVIFIEKDKQAVELIAYNLASLGVKGKGRIIRGNAALLLGGLDADIVFLDPPYPKEKEYQASLDALEAKPPALTVVQHAKRFALDEIYGPLHRTRVVTQGDNSLSFFKYEQDNDPQISEVILP